MKKQPVEEDFGFEPFEPLDSEDEGSFSMDKSEDEFGFEPFDKDEEDVDIEQDESESDLSDNEEFEESEDEPGFWQSVASHPVTQSILGAAKRVTAPLDILKLAMLGEGLGDIDELEESFRAKGIPFDKEDYIDKVYEAASLIPTQGLAEEKIKEYTGIDLEPKDTFSKIIRGGTEIASGGPSGLLKQPAKQVAKQVAKKAAVGIAAQSGAEVAKSLGANAPLSDILASVLGGAAGGKKEPFKLTGNQAKNAATAEKHKLRKFGGLQREEPLKNAIVSKEAQKKATEELSDTSKKAIDKIIADKIPITKQKAMGVDLEDAYTKAFAASENRATKLDKANTAAQKAGVQTKEIDLEPLLNKLKKKILDIQNSAPSLSVSDKAAIRELKKQYKGLSEKKSANTNLITGQKSPSYGPKKITNSQALDQYRNFNEETKGIYRKPEFSGSEEVIKNLYGEMKSDLIEAIEKSSPELGKDLKFANKIFHETSKLNQVTDLMGKAFDNGYNPNKLNQILGSKRNRAFLERDLGKGAVKDMQDIAKYGMDAEKSVLKAIKNPQTLKEIASEMTPLKASLIFTKGTAALPWLIGHDIPQAVSRRVKGALMLNDKTRQSYADYVRHAVSPESSAFKRASRDLSSAIENEYGSEKEFLKFLEEED